MSFRSHDVDRFGGCVRQAVNTRVGIKAICRAGSRVWRGMNQNGISRIVQFQGLAIPGVGDINLSPANSTALLSPLGACCFPGRHAIYGISRDARGPCLVDKPQAKHQEETTGRERLRFCYCTGGLRRARFAVPRVLGSGLVCIEFKEEEK